MQSAQLTKTSPPVVQIAPTIAAHGSLKPASRPYPRSFQDLLGKDEPGPDVAGEFFLQPIFDLRANQVHGYEALFRGVAPEHGDWRSVDYKMLAYLGATKVPAKLFINLSNATIVNVPEELIRRAMENNDLVFEWSESVPNDRDFGAITQRIKGWLGKGIPFVIDDFGSGRDGLERLVAVSHAIGAVKFDGQLIRAMEVGAFAGDYISMTISLLHAYGIKAISECVETDEDFARVRELGFDMVQGFYVDNGHLQPKSA